MDHHRSSAQLVATAVVACALAGCNASTTTVQRPLQVATNPPPSTPTARPAPTLPTLSLSLSLAPPVAAGPFGSRCSPAQLRLGWGGRFSEPTGQHTLELTLTNTSRSGCYLFGYPGISLVDGSGRVLPLRYSRAGDQVVTSRPPGRVDLAPSDTAHVTVNKYRCDAGDLMEATVVRLIPPDATSWLQLTITDNVPMDYCGPGDPGSTVYVSPVGATAGATLAK